MRRMFVLTLLVCAIYDAGAMLELIPSESRKKLLRRAHVWKPTEVARMNILQGAENEVSVPFDATIECEYVQPKSELKGVIPKFLCKTASGHTLRVKYGSENKEIYSEVAATRLFWALGFYADDVYPVQVKCLNCPEKPFQAEPDAPRGTYIYKDAIIEREFPGTVIEEKEDQGWTWKELETISSEDRGAPKAHVDALKLLAVFVQDADTKPDNQRLACFQDQYIDPDGDGKGSCKQPVAMIQDLGATFGSGFAALHISKMDLAAWKKKKVWNTVLEARNRTKTGIGFCIGNLTSSNLAGEEGLNDPPITESGRQFLAGLLNQLTDQQIQDLFHVARVEQLQETIEESGITRKVTVADWVAAFKQKRAEVQDRTCSELRLKD